MSTAGIPPSRIARTHAALNCAACTAYGRPEGPADEEILERLPALNLERAARP